MSFPRRPLAFFLLTLLAGCVAPSAKVESQERPPASADNGPPPPQPGASTEPLFDELDKLNEELWRPSDNYANGALFKCGWRKDNLIWEAGKLALRVDDVGCPAGCSGRPYAGGELQSKKKYGYGRYEARMKPAKLNGAMTGSIFTYNDQPQDEIDIEFIGKDRRFFRAITSRTASANTAPTFSSVTTRPSRSTTTRSSGAPIPSPGSWMASPCTAKTARAARCRKPRARSS